MKGAGRAASNQMREKSGEWAVGTFIEVECKNTYKIQPGVWVGHV